jgi:hypothetical protein
MRAGLAIAIRVIVAAPDAYGLRPSHFLQNGFKWDLCMVCFLLGDLVLKTNVATFRQAPADERFNAFPRQYLLGVIDIGLRAW